MATTYRTVTSISAAGLASILAETHTKNGTLAGDSDVLSETQDIGTSSEIITTGEIVAGTVAVLEIVNLDETNFVSIGFANPVVAGASAIKIKAGQSVLITNPSAALYAIADTGTVKILKRAVEV